jgi:molybdenum-dependent DNA-binding transcriptional regulator ModE
LSIAAIAAAGVPAVFSLIKALLPTLATASTGVVGTVITVLTEYGPLALKEYKALKPIVTDAITALSNNKATTAEQIQQLREMSAVYDHDFDAALAKSRSEDAGDD